MRHQRSIHRAGKSVMNNENRRDTTRVIRVEALFKKALLIHEALHKLLVLENYSFIIYLACGNGGFRLPIIFKNVGHELICFKLLNVFRTRI